MALKSMTGFGEGSATASGIKVVVELSSVNRKQLDINVGLPRNLIALDAQVQNLIRNEFSRGRVSGMVRVDATNGFAGTVTVDEKLAEQYIASLRKTAKRLKLSPSIPRPRGPGHDPFDPRYRGHESRSRGSFAAHDSARA